MEMESSLTPSFNVCVCVCVKVSHIDVITAEQAKDFVEDDTTHG